MKTLSIIIVLLSVYAISSGFQVSSITHYTDWVFNLTLFIPIILVLIFVLAFLIADRKTN